MCGAVESFRWSRHPNYFGEIVIWFGVWVIALPEVSGWGHLILVGPLSVVFFLCFVSGVSHERVRACTRVVDSTSR